MGEGGGDGGNGGKGVRGEGQNGMGEGRRGRVKTRRKGCVGKQDTRVSSAFIKTNNASSSNEVGHDEHSVTRSPPALQKLA